MNKSSQRIIDNLYVRNSITGHNIQTPWEVVGMVVSRLVLDITNEFVNDIVACKYVQSISLKSSKIAVLFNIEFLVALKERGFDMSNVTFFGGCPMKEKVAKQVGCDYEHIDENVPVLDKENKYPMKFDYVIGNPPYGNRNKKLVWLRFIEKSVKLAEKKLIFIAPYNNKGKEAKQFIEERRTWQSEEVGHYFKGISQPDIKILELSKTPVRKYVRKKVDPYKEYVNSYPERKTMNDVLTILSGFSGDGVNSIKNSYNERKKLSSEILVKVTRKGEVWKTIPQEQYDELSEHNNGKIMLASPYLYCVHVYMYKGIIDSCIIKSSLVSNACCIIVPFDTYEEAKKLDDWMKSDEIRNELIKLHNLRISMVGKKGKYVINHKMFKLLPWYE